MFSFKRYVVAAVVVVVVVAAVLPSVALCCLPTVRLSVSRDVSQLLCCCDVVKAFQIRQ